MPDFQITIDLNIHIIEVFIHILDEIILYLYLRNGFFAVTYILR
jgi:hypothetical protein